MQNATGTWRHATLYELSCSVGLPVYLDKHGRWQSSEYGTINNLTMRHLYPLENLRMGAERMVQHRRELWRTARMPEPVARACAIRASTLCTGAWTSPAVTSPSAGRSAYGLSSPDQGVIALLR